MKKTIAYIATILIVIGSIWFGYFIVKNISYKIFYKSMVEQTVRDMVKSDFLK